MGWDGASLNCYGMGWGCTEKMSHGQQACKFKPEIKIYYLGLEIKKYTVESLFLVTVPVVVGGGGGASLTSFTSAALSTWESNKGFDIGTYATKTLE